MHTPWALKKDGSAAVLSVSIKKDDGVLDCGCFEDCNRAQVRLEWAHDDVNEYRICLKVKTPEEDTPVNVAVTTNLITKSGSAVKVQHSRLTCNPFGWKGIFHVTSLPSFPAVITFRVEQED
ncbi:hypothetical protein Pelo_15943 [Pelomyxa schiedti]|nr:hypothetical protein Pelo_15943 [Pelomyxa schiedti]